ncbi:leucine-rich repeat-containing protein 57-like [Daktulosphaira vitifoliae]|uniref:leucine-rich repeat-containing protein 57-like n=1 Tax=Daktulosphaira vitifoliae TaxID=58002 RepID=UPI0021A9EBDF|nr:leucine-rich repeat-containing protein 57-like [Daktulosphaira vitifoliae]
MGNSASLKNHVETSKKTGVLNLSDSHLKQYPETIDVLHPYLRTLDLSKNKFKSLPKTVGQFKELKVLNISNNSLETLPDEINNLLKLETLQLSCNLLKTIPILNNLSNLKRVSIGDNQLSIFPEFLCQLKHLETLDLSKNKITQVPECIKESRLVELNINQNQIRKLPVALAECTRLKTLRIEENCLELVDIPREVLKSSKISLLCAEGNLFDMKSLMGIEEYGIYMARYTEVKKKMF